MITVSIFWALVFALFVTKTEQPNEYHKKSRKWLRGRLTKTSGSLLAVVFLSSCASLRSTSSNRLDQQIAQADGAYRTLDADCVTPYNNAVATIAQEIDGETPAELRSQLDPVQVKVDEPAVELPLVRYHAVRTSPQPKQSLAIGAPVLLEVEVRTAEAAAFFKQLNFTSVHMLSPHDPMLRALARLPIAVPFHSIMGEKHNGAGSDGVVRYASSHLDGANSELIVRSGHNAFNNSEARSEVIRVLREELQRSPAPRRAAATMLAGYAEKRNIVFHKSTAPREDF